jgi:twitching motility protein PilT
MTDGIEPSIRHQVLMVDVRASDLHLHADQPPILRIDGRLSREELPALSAPAIAATLDQIVTREQRQRFDTEKELDFSYVFEGLGRFRVNASLQRGSVALTFRLVRENVPSLEELGLPEICASLALRPRGLVLVTGPTGCGKSTTLAAMIDHLNERESRHVVTVEDPIEYAHTEKKCLISQRELGSDTNSFGAALTHVLRQTDDPDREMDLRRCGRLTRRRRAIWCWLRYTPSAHQTVDRSSTCFLASTAADKGAAIARARGVLCDTRPRADARARAGGGGDGGDVGGAQSDQEGKTHQLPGIIQTVRSPCAR